MAHNIHNLKIGRIEIWLIVVLTIFILGNQWQINSISSGVITGTTFYSGSYGGSISLDSVDLSEIKSTAQSIAALFPIDEIKTAQDAIDIMIPTGTPEYGAAMGVSFDDPIDSLSKLAKAQRALLQGLTPEQKDRFLNLALKPVGISCEYCCGVGPVGIRKDGSSSCGCQHNPALLSVTMWLMQNTDYSDVEILKEVIKWKTLFFPKNMIGLASQIAGGDTSVLKDLPGMVGGC